PAQRGIADATGPAAAVVAPRLVGAVRPSLADASAEIVVATTERSAAVGVRRARWLTCGTVVSIVRLFPKRACSLQGDLAEESAVGAVAELGRPGRHVDARDIDFGDVPDVRIGLAGGIVIGQRRSDRQRRVTWLERLAVQTTFSRCIPGALDRAGDLRAI